MTDDLSPRQWLDALYATARVAHEAVYDTFCTLVDAGRADEEVASLVAESARLTLRELPARLASARELASRLEEQELLDPSTAIATRRAFDQQIGEVDADLDALFAREREIHRVLQRLAENASEL